LDEIRQIFFIKKKPFFAEKGIIFCSKNQCIVRKMLFYCCKNHFFYSLSKKIFMVIKRPFFAEKGFFAEKNDILIFCQKNDFFLLKK
jgi:hypothetical protein